MRLPTLPGPSDVLALGEQLVGLAPRMSRLLSEAEALLHDARALLLRIEGTRQDVMALVLAAASTEVRAAEAVVTLDALRVRVAPVLERLAEVVEPGTVDAAVQLVGEMKSVAPDLHDLLDASKELNDLLGNLPGMGRIKRKVEERQEQESG